MRPFRSEAEACKLTVDWSASRLVEIWNSVSGFAPVKKFTDHKTALARIWKTIQNLDGGVGAQAANVAPAQTPAAQQATPAQKGIRAKQSAKAAKPKRKPPYAAIIYGIPRAR